MRRDVLCFLWLSTGGCEAQRAPDFPQDATVVEPMSAQPFDGQAREAGPEDANQRTERAELADSAAEAPHGPDLAHEATPQDAAATQDPDAALDAQADAGSLCAAPLTQCGDGCFDLRADPRHCGDCDNECPKEFGCHDSLCKIEVGCSDGRREAFVDFVRYPTVAGCAATWPLSSLRAAKLGAPCGDSLGVCAVPADACQHGWHVCGDAASGPTDLTARITQAECDAQLGRWAAALGDHSCTDCGVTSSGAVCCGDACVHQAGTCLWPGTTGWFGVVNGVVNLCSATENAQASNAVGVMCCRD